MHQAVDHGVGLHPDRDVVQKAGDAVVQGAGAVVDTVSRVTSGMDMASLLALAAALGWASGLRLYAVIFVIGMLGATGLLVLPGGMRRKSRSRLTRRSTPAAASASR